MKMLWQVFRRFLLLASGFSLAINLILLVPSLFMLQVFDRVFASRSLDTLGLLAAIATLWLVTGFALDVLRQRVLAQAAGHLDERYASPTLQRLLANASDPTRRADLGQLRDLASIRSFLSGPAIHALFDAPWILVYGALITLFHPTLGLIAGMSALVFVLIAWLSDRLSATAAAQSREAAARAGQFVQSSLQAAEAVGAHGMAPAIAAAWLRDHTEGLDHARSAAGVAGGFAAFSRFLRQLLQIVMLGAGAWLVIEQHSSPGITIASTILLGRMLAPLESITGNWKSISEARAAWQRLAEGADPAEAQADGFALSAPEGRLEVQGLYFRPSPDAAPTLKDVSFTVEPGEVLAVIGASGSGKSTLARLLVGLWTPAAGTVRLDGVHIGNWRREALGPHIGYCPQDVQLVCGTVAQNIARFSEAPSESVVEAARLAQCDDLIARLPRDYETDVGEAGARLSGGQRQRVALARALFCAPKLVVLDEPNASLDAAGEEALIRVIDALRSRRISTVIVTQRMPIVEHADKVLILRDGTVERFGVKKPLQVVEAA